VWCCARALKRCGGFPCTPGRRSGTKSQRVEFRAGIEYLAGGTGESVNIGLDDVELDLK
jgi:hypothetical protein